MGVRRASGSSVHRPTPGAERHISLVGLRSINAGVCGCVFSLHQDQNRDHFGTIAIDIHGMFRHDSTARTTRASGLGWTSTGLPHIQGVHRNLRTNQVDPSSLPQKLPHTISTTSSTHTEFHRWLVLSPSVRVIQFPCAEQN